ncbi:galactokinase [Bombilactobacillus thymidiniphilus]|uniref:galactokinase n=1 Tax=Bombilactobacillus thymidiniphilus TaxID=2923363 RepID=UPI0037C05573
MTKQVLQNNFMQQFSKQPTACYFSPGRINLIGEHIDYNGGLVLPCAISLGTYAAIAPRNDQKLQLYSANFPDDILTIDLQNLSTKAQGLWSDYVIGVCRGLQQQGYQLPHGFDIFIQGDLPASAGLSSSASLELLIGMIFREQFGWDLSLEQLAQLGQKAENDFVGVNSGIMDQFAVALGKENNALILNTATLAYDYVPLDLKDYCIVIMNSKQPRQLANSKYNQRRNECEMALQLLQAKLAIAQLCELTPERLDEYGYLFADPLLFKRARHVVWENNRTLNAQKALQQHDLATFGRLLNASHYSLQQDYEVTGVALDCLVTTAWQQPETIGARMTGAGFGGCAIALVAQAGVDHFVQTVGEQYQQAIGHEADFYIAHVANGPYQLKD